MIPTPGASPSDPEPELFPATAVAIRVVFPTLEGSLNGLPETGNRADQSITIRTTATEFGVGSPFSFVESFDHTRSAIHKGNGFWQVRNRIQTLPLYVIHLGTDIMDVYQHLNREACLMLSAETPDMETELPLFPDDNN